MFQSPGELAFYLVVVSVELAGYFVFMLVAQSWYRSDRDFLRAAVGSLSATGIGAAILFSLSALWSLLARRLPDWNWYSAQGLLLLCLLLACLRYVAWLLVLWMSFQKDFGSRPSAGYAVVAMCASFGLDVLGLAIAIATPAGRSVFFF